MSKSLKNLALLAVGPALLTAVPANATVTLSGTGLATTLTTSGASGGSATIFFDGITDGPTLIAGLTSKLTLTFNSLVGSTATFGYKVENTSSTPITDSRVSVFGFNSAPNITGGSSTGTFAVFTPGGGNVPNFGDAEFCAKASGNNNNCSGGGGDGTAQGGSDSGILTLTFGSSPSSVVLSDFFVRYQSIAGAGAVQSAVGRPTTPAVPEPAAWMMMILGFGGIGFAMRKRTHAPQARVRFI